MLRLNDERWGGLTAEAQDLRAMMAKNLAQRLYRSSNISPLARLLERYGEKLLKFSSFDHDGQMSIRQAFGLHPKDGKTMFATWRHFLTACMASHTPMAKEMQAYIKHMEEEARVRVVVEYETGLSPDQLARRQQHRIEQRG